jgi:hypothetical protein
LKAVAFKLWVKLHLKKQRLGKPGDHTWRTCLTCKAGSRGRLKGCNQALSSHGSTAFNVYHKAPTVRSRLSLASLTAPSRSGTQVNTNLKEAWQSFGKSFGNVWQQGLGAKFTDGRRHAGALGVDWMQRVQLYSPPTPRLAPAAAPRPRGPRPVRCSPLRSASSCWGAGARSWIQTRQTRRRRRGGRRGASSRGTAPRRRTKACYGALLLPSLYAAHKEHVTCGLQWAHSTLEQKATTTSEKKKPRKNT